MLLRMPWRFRRASLAMSCVIASCVAVGSASAADKPRGSAAPSAGTPSDAEAEAQKHFAKARDLYRQGAYREAIVELEAAVKLDPTGKELVYNLGVLHEKLGDIDEALASFRKYATMDLTQEEREKNEAAIRRLEGAKKEIEDKKKAEQPPPPPPPPPPTPTNGRIDAATISLAGVSVVGLAFGIVFAVRAESQKPPSGFVTGRDGTYANLQSQTDSAHKSAIVADVGFGVGIAAGVTAALLYALRSKQAPKREVTGHATVSAAPLPGGGAVVIGGAF
jgi:tetratricopeptide (TPR) repeat protein